ncbi:hypothetical protein TIFTF001_035643 [Ficus carica]|uniref:Uncharacterized protein n=1 Tax=Ficus carica TaxID=3494 RepID=A0AA88E1Y7_FICCA|nr:hypothetical protein TIFTF001_035643 [Ficus carica]
MADPASDRSWKKIGPRSSRDGGSVVGGDSRHRRCVGGRETAGPVEASTSSRGSGEMVELWSEEIDIGDRSRFFPTEIARPFALLPDIGACEIETHAGDLAPPLVISELRRTGDGVVIGVGNERGRKRSGGCVDSGEL